MILRPLFFLVFHLNCFPFATLRPLWSPSAKFYFTIISLSVVKDFISASLTSFLSRAYKIITLSLSLNFKCKCCASYESTVPFVKQTTPVMNFDIVKFRSRRLPGRYRTPSLWCREGVAQQEAITPRPWLWFPLFPDLHVNIAVAIFLSPPLSGQWVTYRSNMSGGDRRRNATPRSAAVKARARSQNKLT